jgi:hypothetical protein
MHKTTMNMLGRLISVVSLNYGSSISEDSISPTVIDYSSHNHGGDGIIERVRQPAIYQICLPLLRREQVTCASK